MFTTRARRLPPKGGRSTPARSQPRVRAGNTRFWTRVSLYTRGINYNYPSEWACWLILKEIQRKQRAKSKNPRIIMNNQDYHDRHGQTFLTLQESLLTNFQLIRKDIVDHPRIQGYPSSKPSVSASYPGIAFPLYFLCWTGTWKFS